MAALPGAGIATVERQILNLVRQNYVAKVKMKFVMAYLTPTEVDEFYKRCGKFHT